MAGPNLWYRIHPRINQDKAQSAFDLVAKQFHILFRITSDVVIVEPAHSMHPYLTIRGYNASGKRHRSTWRPGRNIVAVTRARELPLNAGDPTECAAALLHPGLAGGEAVQAYMGDVGEEVIW
ncbi:hypothetical protein ONZ45_g13808 [Pleurotus djamor]|nr:hypothetical protein ONZ45_g13808 [Pleurotus djamor]